MVFTKHSVEKRKLSLYVFITFGVMISAYFCGANELPLKRSKNVLSANNGVSTMVKVRKNGMAASPEMCYFCFDVLYCHQQGLDPPETFFDDAHPLFVTWEITNTRHYKDTFMVRGCKGTLNATNLKSGLREYAISAFKDPLFSHITKNGFSNLRVSVDILKDFENASDYLDWTIGTHGIRIEFYTKNGSKKTATYLPEVALKKGWTKVKTIDNLLRQGGYKGNISNNVRRSIKLTRYQSEKVSATYNDYKKILHRCRKATNASEGSTARIESIDLETTTVGTIMKAIKVAASPTAESKESIKLAFSIKATSLEAFKMATPLTTISMDAIELTTSLTKTRIEYATSSTATSVAGIKLVEPSTASNTEVINLAAPSTATSIQSIELANPSTKTNIEAIKSTYPSTATSIQAIEMVYPSLTTSMKAIKWAESLKTKNMKGIELANPLLTASTETINLADPSTTRSKEVLEMSIPSKTPSMEAIRLNGPSTETSRP